MSKSATTVLRLAIFMLPSMLVANASLAQLQDAVAAAPADAPAPEHPTETIELTVHAAAAPRPVLKYRLLPSYLERTPGNAVPVYAKAFLSLAGREFNKQHTEWLDKTPLGELPTKEVRKELEGYAYALEVAEIAAAREHCHWDPPVRESKNIFAILLPEAHGSRDLARYLALRARVEIAEGKIDEAIGTIRTLFALSRHVSQQPFLISGLVAVVIERIAAARVEELIQQTDAPNLYWALTDLPSPLVDLRTGLDVEYAALVLVFPELRKLRGVDYADGQWDRLLDQFAKRLEDMATMFDSEATEIANMAKGIGRRERQFDDLYKDAKQRLQQRGESQESIGAMPKSRVILLDIHDSFVEARDEMFKGFSLPYAQAAVAFEDGSKAAQRAKNHGVGGQLAAMLMPAVNAASLASVEGQRRIESLRTIEALRLYAAEHGRLPAKLADITSVPIPQNPVTGKPFGYSLNDGVATLDATGPRRSRQYRIRLAK